MQFLEMANLSRQKADQWLPQKWKQRSSKSGGYSIGGKQVNTTRLGDGCTTLQTDFTNMTFILTRGGYYDMQTIPQETVLKGGARSQAALVDPSVAQSACPRHFPDSMSLFWKVLESLLNQEPPLETLLHPHFTPKELVSSLNHPSTCAWTFYFHHL